MEMGETVAKVMAMQAEGKCVLCGEPHDEAKKAAVESTVSKDGWERDKSLVDVFERADAQRAAIYPNTRFPPPYPTEGHHCLAFTSFIRGGKDRALRLNSFLNKVGFKPNQPSNIIHLPDRHGAVPPGASAMTAWPAGVKKEYKSFWVSIDLGRPLQLHLGRHVGSYFAASDGLYLELLRHALDVETCKDESMQEFEEALKELIHGAVNYAFIQVAGGRWLCHPEQVRIATDLYGKTGKHAYFHSGRKRNVEHEGYPGTGARPPPWTKVTLDTTPF